MTLFGFIISVVVSMLLLAVIACVAHFRVKKDMAAMHPTREPLPDIEETAVLEARISDLEKMVLADSKTIARLNTENSELRKRAVAAEEKVQRWSEILVAMLRSEHITKDPFSNEALAS
jgi:hypothetical protein